MGLAVGLSARVPGSADSYFYYLYPMGLTVGLSARVPGPAESYFFRILCITLEKQGQKKYVSMFSIFWVINFSK